jgi:hypothetical protein
MGDEEEGREDAKDAKRERGEKGEIELKNVFVSINEGVYINSLI